MNNVNFLARAALDPRFGPAVGGGAPPERQCEVSAGAVDLRLET